MLGGFLVGNPDMEAGSFGNATWPDGPGMVMGYLLTGKCMTTMIHMGRSPFRRLQDPICSEK